MELFPGASSSPFPPRSILHRRSRWHKQFPGPLPPKRETCRCADCASRSILGAIVDLSGAIPLLFFPSWMSAWLGERVPIASSSGRCTRPCFCSCCRSFTCSAPRIPRGTSSSSSPPSSVGLPGRCSTECAFFSSRSTPFSRRMSIMNLLFALYYAGALGPAGRMLIRGALRPPR